jgi:hypothetical protein
VHIFGTALTLQVQIAAKPSDDRLQVRGYWYELRDNAGTELLLFHWHPAGRSAAQRPHLHVKLGGEVPDWMQKAHVPTGYLQPPDLFDFLVQDLGARPRGAGWQNAVDRSRSQLTRHFEVPL